MGKSGSKSKVDARDSFYMQGHYQSGKSHLLYRLGNDDQPSVDYLRWAENTGEVKLDGSPMYAHDENGGRRAEGRLLHLYLSFCKGIVFVVDSADKESLEDAIDKLETDILTPESLGHAVVMIAANKQDLEGAMTPQEIEDIVKKSCKVNRRMTVFVMPTSAVTGDGVKLAFDYFMKVIKFKDKKVLKPGLIPQAWEKAAVQMEKQNFDSILVPKKTLPGEKKKTFLKAVKNILSY